MVATRDDRPSVTQSAPWLAGIRLTLAQVPLRQVLGVVAVLAWAIWLTATWVTQPRVVPPGQVESDLATGKVMGFAVVTLVDKPSGWFDSTNSPEVSPGPEQGRDALREPDADEWSTGNGRPTIAYWVDAPVAALRVVDPNIASPLALEAIADRLDTNGIEDRTTSVTFTTFSGGVGKAGTALSLGALLVVIMGPRPSRGNRWFWFWMLGLPFGLGLLALAVLEILRPRPPDAPLDEVAALDGSPRSTGSMSHRRYGGWAGFWLSIAASMLIGEVAPALATAQPLVFMLP